MNVEVQDERVALNPGVAHRFAAKEKEQELLKIQGE
jgi:hypothetical protein